MGIANDMMEDRWALLAEVNRLRKALEAILATKGDSAWDDYLETQRIATVALGDRAYNPETFEVE
jgi:hypothetical protein